MWHRHAKQTNVALFFFLQNHWVCSRCLHFLHSASFFSLQYPNIYFFYFECNFWRFQATWINLLFCVRHCNIFLYLFPIHYKWKVKPYLNNMRSTEIFILLLRFYIILFQLRIINLIRIELFENACTCHSHIYRKNWLFKLRSPCIPFLLCYIQIGIVKS